MLHTGVSRVFRVGRDAVPIILRSRSESSTKDVVYCRNWEWMRQLQGFPLNRVCAWECVNVTGGGVRAG